MIGNGVEIGGSGFINPKNQMDFKNYWKDKEQEEVAENAINNIGNAV